MNKVSTLLSSLFLLTTPKFVNSTDSVCEIFLNNTAISQLVVKSYLFCGVFSKDIFFFMFLFWFHV